MVEVTIGSKTFHSQGEATAYIRTILGRGPHVPPEQEFLRALLERHPRAVEKISVGVREIRVGKDKFGGNQFQVVRIDDTWIDFSYLPAVRGESMSNKGRVSKALRQEIVPQVLVAKNNMLRECAICGGSTDAHFDADHYPVPFEEIADDFLANEGLSYNEVGVRPAPGGRSGELIINDSILASRWRDYHAARATYRPVHVRCHKRRKRTR